MIRTVVVSTVSMCAVVVLLMAPFWRFLLMANQIKHAQMSVYLIPQALPLAILIGLTLGILFGFRGRVLSGRLTRMVLTMAVAWSATSFAILVWLLPAANQSYREWVADSNGITQDTIKKGMGEMTLAELSDQINSYRGTAMAGSRIVRNLTFSYHQRWSLACAPTVLALFAVGVLARRPSARWTVGMAAIGTCFGYYALLFLGRSAALGGAIPASAGAWFPNVVFVLLSALLLKIASSRPEDPVPTR